MLPWTECLRFCRRRKWLHWVSIGWRGSSLASARRTHSTQSPFEPRRGGPKRACHRRLRRLLLRAANQQWYSFWHGAKDLQENSRRGRRCQVHQPILGAASQQRPVHHSWQGERRKYPHGLLNRLIKWEPLWDPEHLRLRWHTLRPWKINRL